MRNESTTEVLAIAVGLVPVAAVPGSARADGAKRSAVLARIVTGRVAPGIARPTPGASGSVVRRSA